MVNKYKVIIPCYNEEKTISLVLDSLVEQTITPDEVIVVNDGSTDNSLTIIEDYCSRYSFIKVVTQEHNKNKGRQDSI